MKIERSAERLTDIERGFRVLKSEIEIAPVFHRLPNRIRAHALICFLALVLYWVRRMRLKARDSQLSPERALEIVRRIQFRQITLHQRQSASGLMLIAPAADIRTVRLGHLDYRSMTT